MSLIMELLSCKEIFKMIFYGIPKMTGLSIIEIKRRWKSKDDIFAEELDRVIKEIKERK